MFAGAVSLVFAVSVQGQTAMTIHDLQGSGLSTAYSGQQVQVEGIVTAVVPTGCYVQLPDVEADDDPQTSEGVFVYTGGMPAVSVGDRVRVTGQATEYFDLTEIGGGADIDVLSSGHELPNPVHLGETFPSPDQPWPGTDLERVEGMLVEITDGTLCSGLDSFGKAYVTAAAERAFREKGIRYPGETGLPVWDGNPQVFQMMPGVPAEEVLGGNTVTSAWGPLSYSFGEYVLLAVTCELVQRPFPEPIRDRNGGEILLVTQNLHQLDQDASGYDDRLTKISDAVRNLMKRPDMIGFQEVNSRDELMDLAARLATDEPGLAYTVQYTSPDFGMGIGYLVQDTVDVTSLTQIQDGETFSFDGKTYTLHDRPPLLLECEAQPAGDTMAFSVILVHLRSLNGIDDAGDGPFVREKRYRQSLRLSQYVADYQFNHPDRPLVVMGDFNAFPFTDGYVDVTGQVTGSPDAAGAMIPATDEVDPDLENLMGRVPETSRYTYLHEGTAQVIDQVLISSTGEPLVRDVEVIHHSSDAPEGLETDPSTVMGLSDHDGVALFLGPLTLPVIDSFSEGPDYLLTVQAHDPDGGTIDAYRWCWADDAETSETWTVSGTYQPPFVRSGTYTVSVQAWDDDGQWSSVASLEMDVTVSVSVSRPVPVAGHTGDYVPVDYLVNTREEPLPVQLVPYSTGTAGEPVSVDVPAGGKLWINDMSRLPETMDMLTLEMDHGLPILCELTSEMAAMTALLDAISSQRLFIPHIAEEVHFWNTAIFVSASEPGAPAIAVPGGGTQDVDGQASLTAVESLLPEPITVATSWGEVTDETANLSGIELFVKEGNDGAATELVSRPSEFLYIPHIPTETEIFWTGFAFLNTGGAEANLTFHFYGGSGELLGSADLLIPAGAKIKGLMTDLFPDVAGTAQWGTVLSTEPIIGIELYGTYSAGICGFTLPDISRTDLVLPSMWAGEGLWTGVAATNPGDKTAALVVQLVSKDGVVKAEKTESLAGMRRLAFVVADYFEPASVKATDYVRIISDQPLTAIEAAGDLERTFMTGLAAGR